MAKQSGGIRSNASKGGNIVSIIDRSNITSDMPMSRLSEKDKELFAKNVSNIISKGGIDPKGVRLIFERSGFVIRDRFTEKFYVERNFSKDGKEVYHNWFRIYDEKLQGQGLAKKIINASMPIYEKLGVEKISVHAALKNGGYTWAKMGFHATNRIEAQDAVNQITNYESRIAAQRALHNFYFNADGSIRHSSTTPFPMAKLANNPKVGKALVGTNWLGSIDLTNPNKARYFKNYIGYKK